MKRRFVQRAAVAVAATALAAGASALLGGLRSPVVGRQPWPAR